MSTVKALKRNEIADIIGWNGDAEILDLLSGITYKIRGSVAKTYDHSDYQTINSTETAKKKQAGGGTWNWNARPVLLLLKGHRIAASTHTFPHSIPVAWQSDNIVNPPLTRANERDANGKWRIGSHFCLHYIDTINMRTADTWSMQMNAAVKKALELGNAPAKQTVSEPKPEPVKKVEINPNPEPTLTVIPSIMKFTINASKINETKSYNINGSNYPNLRELMDILSIKVDYDPTTNIISLRKGD
ncbi:MAG: hypothetical protein FWC41_00515 [Firmicutes bacterium]|nr:hypothetical protein [Bacillota bacterium]